MSKKWSSRFNAFVFESICWLPIVIMLLQLFRLGFSDILLSNLSNFNNPLVPTFEKLAEVLDLTATTYSYNVCVYMLSWSLFIHLIWIIYACLHEFLDMIMKFIYKEVK